MSACVSCHAEIASDANFCARCGTPVGAVRADDGRDGLVTLIGTQPSVSESVARRGGRSRLPILAGLVAAAAVFVFLAVRSPEPDGNLGVAQDDDVGANALIDNALFDNALLDDSAPIDDAAEVDDAAEATPQLNTAAEPARSRSATSIDEPTGYRVIAANGDQLLDINLDSGEVAGYGLGYEIVGAVDDEIFVFDASIGFKAVPTNDLSDSGRVVFSIPEVQASETRVSTNSLHAAAFRPPSTLILGFDPSLNSPRDHQPLVFQLDVDTGRFRAFELEGSTEQLPFSRARNGLVWTAGGGLFDVSSGLYRKMSDGYPLLLGVRYVIVQVCERPSFCEYQWLQRTFAEDPQPAATNPIPGRPLPDLDGVFWINEIDSEARMLVLLGNDGPHFYDVVRDRILPGTVSTSDDPAGSRFHSSTALSDDGRWLARVVGRRLLVYDLDHDVDYILNPGPGIEGSSVVFVPIGEP